jgi:four helix bundle protein
VRKDGDRELRRFARVALGPASELEYHLLLARDLNLMQEPVHERLTGMAVEIKRMLSGLAARLTAQLETDG